MRDKYRKHINVIAWWVVVFGLWPLADPDHSGTSLLTVVDIALHYAATVYLVRRVIGTDRFAITVSILRWEPKDKT